MRSLFIKNNLKTFTRLSTALIMGSCLLGGSNSWANTSNVDIVSANTFTVASSPLGGLGGCNVVVGSHMYASQRFTATSTASHTIETTAATVNYSGGAASNNDTFIALYSGNFNPASPTVGLVACNDDIGGGSVLSRITSNLTTGSGYEIVITTYTSTANINGATGVVLSFTPNVTLGAVTPTGPTAPTGLTATAVSATQINLSWADNSSDETGFKIYQPAAAPLPLITTAANATSYSHTGLTCNTTYSYTVEATNANGDSTSITANATTLACPVPALIDLNFNKQPETYSNEIELK